MNSKICVHRTGWNGLCVSVLDYDGAGRMKMFSFSFFSFLFSRIQIQRKNIKAATKCNNV